MAITYNPALKENAPAPAPAPNATASAPQPKAGTAKTKTTSEDSAFRKVGREMIAGMSEDQRQAMGSKSNTLEFVAALGDPRVRQDRVEGGATKTSHVVLGFRFKALEPMTYSKKPYKPEAADIIDVDYACTEEVPVQAGETFDLNLMETARMLANPLYAGAATGGERGVQLSFKESQSRKDPLPVLTCIGKGSVKEGMILVGNKNADGSYQVGDEFAEKFGALFRKKTKVSKGAAKSNTAAREEVSASFLAFFTKKEQEARG